MTYKDALKYPSLGGNLHCIINIMFDDIALQIDRSTAQLSGMLGALGQRINNTTSIEGKPGITYFLNIKKEFDDDPGALGWVMRYELQEIIRSGNYDLAEEWK